MSLRLSGISKTFGGFAALTDADFLARKGEIHALLGENGAGKSTLMNVAAGLYAPDAGRIEKDDATLSLSGPGDARARGIGMVHQHFKLVGPFTVAENVLLSHPRGSHRAALQSVAADIAKLASELDLAVDPHRRVATLSVAEQQRVEILRALLGGADILILDEPTAVLTDNEAQSLMRTLRRLAAKDSTIVVVTHKLQEVIAHADRVTIMRAGQTIATTDPGSLSVAELTRLVVGEETSAPMRPPSDVGETKLRVADLRLAGEGGRPGLDGVSFSVRAGEIYGLAGVSGNGQSELAEALMGLSRPHSGAVEVAKGRFAKIPADRSIHALAGSASIAENVAARDVNEGRLGSWLRIDRRALRKRACAALKAFDVQGVRSLDQKAALLSGGNAQKLVLARELSGEPSVVLAHGPSRGLDARAAAAVQGRLIAARQSGAAVLLISDDLDEILALSDRIGVMSRGRVVAEFDSPADRAEIGKAMVAHA